MIDNLKNMNCHRLCALENIEANKLTTAKQYNKKVKNKQFAEEDLVWKVILPIGTKDSKFGKWSPNWEGPYQIKHCVPGNAYILESLEGEEFDRAFNGKFLKSIIQAFGSIPDSRLMNNQALIDDFLRIAFSAKNKNKYRQDEVHGYSRRF
jgi:hypothetical protein